MIATNIATRAPQTAVEIGMSELATWREARARRDCACRAKRQGMCDVRARLRARRGSLRRAVRVT